MKIGMSVIHFGEAEKTTCLKSLEENGCSISKYESFQGFIKNTKDVFYTIVKDNNIENAGFTVGNNLVIDKFLNFDRGNKFDWIWLLNNDTVVSPETLTAIELKLSVMDSKVGVVGFQVRSMDDHDFIHHGGTGQCFPSGVHKVGSVKLGQLNKQTEEKWVTFASVLIRREVFEQIGLLDENMKFIGSDSDFCFRARAAGFKVIYEPSFVIYHKIGQSQETKNPKLLSQMQQDMVYFQGKWLNGKLYFDLEKELLQ